MQIGKKDIIWSYAAQFLSIASGVIVLPMVLRLLSAEEIGFNYIILSIGALVSLVDFGFSPQFARNITYVYSGARNLQKEGVHTQSAKENTDIDYRLLSALISTARWVFSLLGFAALVLLATVGTYYVYDVSKGFTLVPNAQWIWLLFSLSIFFNIYYAYYNSLLLGSGQIIKAKKVMVIVTSVRIIASYVVLLAGLGLLGVILVNLLSPFLSRFLSYYFYFTKDFKQNIKDYKANIKEKKELFSILWYNSKRGGVCAIAGFLTHQTTIIIASLFLSLSEVGSFGLMQQLFGVLSGVALTAFTIYQPQMAYLIAKENKEELIRKVAFTMHISYIIFFIGAIVLVFLGNPILQFIGSQSVLPSISILLVFAFIWFLNANFWNLCQVLTAANTYPFVKSVLVTGVAIIALSYVFLYFFDMGVWGLVLGMGVSQIVWNDWYWVCRVMQFLGVSYISFLRKGQLEMVKYINNNIFYKRTAYEPV